MVLAPQLLAVAKAEAAQMVSSYRQSDEMALPQGERKSVYILEGCVCTDRGASHRYHVHAFTPQDWRAWHATHGVTVVASYPL